MLIFHRPYPDFNFIIKQKKLRGYNLYYIKLNDLKK